MKKILLLIITTFSGIGIILFGFKVHAQIQEAQSGFSNTITTNLNISPNTGILLNMVKIGESQKEDLQIFKFIDDTLPIGLGIETCWIVKNSLSVSISCNNF